jgi:hypothetical protein
MFQSSFNTSGKFRVTAFRDTLENLRKMRCTKGIEEVFRCCLYCLLVKQTLNLIQRSSSLTKIYKLFVWNEYLKNLVCKLKPIIIESYTESNDRIFRKFSRVSRKAVTRNFPDVLKLFHRHGGMDNPDVLKLFYRHSVWMIRISVLVKVNGIRHYSFIDLILKSEIPVFRCCLYCLLMK